MTSGTFGLPVLMDVHESHAQTEGELQKRWRLNPSEVQKEKHKQATTSAVAGGRSIVKNRGRGLGEGATEQ